MYDKKKEIFAYIRYIVYFCQHTLTKNVQPSPRSYLWLERKRDNEQMAGLFCKCGPWSMARS